MSSIKSENLLIKQGHCYLVNMNPPIKSKPGKIRPAVVLQSNDVLNTETISITLVPLTTKLEKENILRCRVSPSAQLKIEKPSDILIDQIHTLHRSFFIKELGPLAEIDLLKIKQGLDFLLNFSQTLQLLH
ncbi:MAG: type II toxin-antitoxin system PemK/MazF family toxin [Deltaproteobacteria bacterium]|nr:type II toxin-antitoxin system PemK/MazF family toxin [Deltaproteobacteria bacterium]